MAAALNTPFVPVGKIDLHVLAAHQDEPMIVLDRFHVEKYNLEWKVPAWNQKKNIHSFPAANQTANQKVLDFVYSRLNTQVGDGQCATLASEALAYAGAKNFDVLGPNGPDADYVWGTPVATLTPASHPTASIIPGDIIQFRDVLIVTRTVYPNGSWAESQMQALHHTAIVTNVSGNTLTIAQQNSNGVMQDQLATLNVDGLTEGTMWVYRPIAT